MVSGDLQSKPRKSHFKKIIIPIHYRICVITLVFEQKNHCFFKIQ